MIAAALEIRVETDSQRPPAATVGSDSGVTELLLDPGVGGGIDLGELCAWSDRLVAEAAPGTASLAIRLTDEAAMQALNRDFRQLDRPTDVLSFPGEITPEGQHLGDIVIALPVAARQADAAGHPLATELKTLVLHGVLHCLGHDHETDDGEMEALEGELRKLWIGDDD